MSKKSTDTFTCDLCHESSQVVAGLFPLDWVKVQYEPTEDQTFVEKHVCRHCVSQIKYPKGKT